MKAKLIKITVPAAALVGLLALVGPKTAEYLAESVPKHEGVAINGYLDPIGIPTKCMGDTNDVIVGKQYTVPECIVSMDLQLTKHAQGVLQCVPGLKDKPEFLAASVSFAYNFGVFAYCNSSVAIEFKKGNYAIACKRFNENALGKPQYIFVKDKFVNGKWTYKTLSGLVSRRADERKLCEKGL